MSFFLSKRKRSMYRVIAKRLRHGTLTAAVPVRVRVALFFGL